MPRSVAVNRRFSRGAAPVARDMNMRSSTRNLARDDRTAPKTAHQSVPYSFTLEPSHCSPSVLPILVGLVPLTATAWQASAPREFSRPVACLAAGSHPPPAPQTRVRDSFGATGRIVGSVELEALSAVSGSQSAAVCSAME